MLSQGVVEYRWKKGFSPSNLHFFWVARKSDLTTFKWLLVLLPEVRQQARPTLPSSLPLLATKASPSQLVAKELKHNEFYGAENEKLKVPALPASLPLQTHSFETRGGFISFAGAARSSEESQAEPGERLVARPRLGGGAK